MLLKTNKSVENTTGEGQTDELIVTPRCRSHFQYWSFFLVCLLSNILRPNEKFRFITACQHLFYTNVTDELCVTMAPYSYKHFKLSKNSDEGIDEWIHPQHYTSSSVRQLEFSTNIPTLGQMFCWLCGRFVVAAAETRKRKETRTSSLCLAASSAAGRVTARLAGGSKYLCDSS